MMPIFQPSPARERGYVPQATSPSPGPRETAPILPPPGSSLYEEQPEPQPAAPVVVLDVTEAPGYNDKWVTVYGFPSERTSALSAVLQEFQACGNIQHWTLGPAANCNWLHIQYETPAGAQRALQRNGTRLAGLNLIVGVVPPSAADRRHLDDRVERGWGASGVGAALPVRPYVLHSSAKMAPVPQPQKLWSQRVCEFLFGS